MTAAETVDLIVKVLVGVGGLAGVGALFMVRAQKRKLLADTGKTDAEADSVLADAQAKRTAREVSLIEPYERIQNRLSRELDEAYAEIDRLKDWVALLTDAMKAAGIHVPDEPPKVHRQHPTTDPRMRAVRASQ